MEKSKDLMRPKSATEIHVLADKLKADRHMENIMVGERTFSHVS